jgi:hypothetical protein
LKHANLSRLAWATVLAVCVHLMALMLMGWRIPRLAASSSIEDENVAVEVILVRPPVPPRVPFRAKGPGSALSAPRAPARVLITPTPGAPAMSAPVQSPPGPSPAEASRDAQNLRNVLRGLVGCADPAASGLSREERAACDQRLAAAKPVPVGPQFSAQELSEFNADKTYDPLLVRKPHNGCLPRLADTPRPDHVPPRPTRSGAGTTYGGGCAWSF